MSICSMFIYIITLKTLKSTKTVRQICRILEEKFFFQN
uniref:Uncharacterized protein n=2 Tax=unclassified Caudoviricetes TaxID=2788787 RepID=A0A8S5NHE0_9CAUD|nr:MAG TPA: hypothetical protein [Siphoviridae sp. ctUF252]DAE01556.1 MAG TPA: hypothetical protein [Siphoviridae sp. ctZHt25]